MDDSSRILKPLMGADMNQTHPSPPATEFVLPPIRRLMRRPSIEQLAPIRTHHRSVSDISAYTHHYRSSSDVSLMSPPSSMASPKSTTSSSVPAGGAFKFTGVDLKMERLSMDPAPPMHGHYQHRRTASFDKFNWVMSNAESFHPADHGKKKRRRTTEDQLRILNQFFSHTPLPNAQQREELAISTGMTPRSVQVWFQNKRQTMKKQQSKEGLQTHNESSPIEDQNVDVAQVLVGLSRRPDSPTDKVFNFPM
ncbi:hypothetical protein EDD86DRAFT_196649 [Gorgonomyces haynaldii]|nr:hypothetical protein EDD86DRAFT_196649 [Gorgonomyces haynaldii]